MESVGPVVPTNEVETKFETIKVTNGVCWPSGPNKKPENKMSINNSYVVPTTGYFLL